MKSFAEHLTAAMKDAGIKNSELAKQVRSIKNYRTTSSDSSSNNVSAVTISRWKNGTVIKGKLQKPSIRGNVLDMIRPLGLPQKNMDGVETCDSLLKAAEFPALNDEEKKTYFPQLKFERQPQECRKSDLQTITPEIQQPKTKLIEHEKQQTLARQDWGEVRDLDISVFYGRIDELKRLEQWIVTDKCRLITVLGMGGIGKTTLTVKLAKSISDQFQYVIWRSLSEAPPVQKILTDSIKLMSGQQKIELPDTVGEHITQLIDYLKQSRCLLVLDNVESILQAGTDAGQYQQEYEKYGELIKRVAESSHQSCLVLTSREKPKRIQKSQTTHSYWLKGLDKSDGDIFFREANAFPSSNLERVKIINHYAGNPLALKMVIAGIREQFNGKISDFMDWLDKGEFMFNDIRDLLQRQLSRLSKPELEVIYWLAINRQPVSMKELSEDVLSRQLKLKVPNAIGSLKNRLMIESVGDNFTLLEAVREYTTEQLMNDVVNEMKTGNISLLDSHTLLKSQSPDHVREAQERRILMPLMDRLIDEWGRQTAENKLLQLLSKWRQEFPRKPGYLAGNIFNLLCQLHSNELRDYDFSELTIWQAYLQGVKLHYINFAHAQFAQDDSIESNKTPSRELAKSVFTQHFGSILAVAFSPNGEWLATGDVNGEVRVWRIVDGKQMVTLRGHTAWIRSVAFSPDGPILVSGSEDQTIRIWEISEVENGKLVKTLQHNHRVRSIAFSANGQRLVSGSDDCTVKLWNTQDWQCLHTLKHEDFVLAVAISPDGQIVAGADDDEVVVLWNARDGQCLKILSGHEDSILSVAFSHDGQLLASGSEDKTVRLWNVSTGQCVNTLTGHSSWIWSVAFNSNNILASGSADHTVRLWDIQSGQCLNTLQGHTNDVRSVAFSPEGKTLATGSDDKTMKLWEVRQGDCLKTWHGYTNWLWSVAFSPEGRRIASDNADHIVRIWDIQTGKCLQELQGHKNLVRATLFSSEGHLITGSDDKTIKKWDVETGKVLNNWKVQTRSVRAMAVSPKQWLAYCGEDQHVRLLRLVDGEEFMLPGNTKHWVWSVAFSPDGQFLFSSGDEEIIRIWDFRQRECLGILKGHTNSVRAIAVSHDGKMLASGSEDNTVKLWDVDKRHCSKTLTEHKNWVWSVAFSPDGQLIASGSKDYTVRIWEIASGRCRHILEHRNHVRSVAFSPYDQILASGGEDGTIILWDVKTGSLLKPLTAPKPYEGMNISGVTGLTSAQIASLEALGAVEKKNDKGFICCPKIRMLLN